MTTTNFPAGSMTTTMNTRMRCFTTARGNRVEVWNTKQVTTARGWRGCTETVRTWANVCGTTVEVPAGEGFRAERCVNEAGF